MKTAEDFLRKFKVIEGTLIPGSAIEAAMQEYAAQQVAAERERIKEIIVKNYVGIHPVPFNKIIELIDSL